MRCIHTSFWLRVVMITRSRIVLAVISLFVCLLVCSSEAQAIYVYMRAKATGGGNLALNANDSTDGWAGDYDAEATHTSPDSPYQDQGYAKVSLTGAGVELKSKSYAPDVYANSAAQFHHHFRLDTTSGTDGAVLNAVLNFTLTGTIQVLNAQDSEGTIWVKLMARQGGTSGPFLDYKLIRYDVYWDGLGYVGSNDTTSDDLFPVYPTITGPGPTYTFNVPLSLNLEAMEADDLIGAAEDAVSSPTYETLKRDDEGRIVYNAHKNPKFVEDVVRDVLKTLRDRFTSLPDDARITVRSLSEESIHKHNAFAERVTSMGKLRE